MHSVSDSASQSSNKDKPKRKGVSTQNPNIVNRARSMILEEYYESNSTEDDDDTDADPDFVLPNDESPYSDGDENDSDVPVSDEELENELELDNVLDLGKQRRLPAYVSGRLRKQEAGPPYFWSTTEQPQNVRTPATNIIRGGLPAQSRALGFESEPITVWNL